MSLELEAKRAKFGAELIKTRDAIAQAQQNATNAAVALAALRDELIACDGNFSNRPEVIRFTGAIASRRKQLVDAMTLMETDDDFGVMDTAEYQNLIDIIDAG